MNVTTLIKRLYLTSTISTTVVTILLADDDAGGLGAHQQHGLDLVHGLL